MESFVAEQQEAVEPADVRRSARDFAVALSETPEFVAYEMAAERLNHDADAQRAMAAYQAKQQSLKMLLMLNAVSAEERSDLEQLYQSLVDNPSVVAYTAAQGALMDVCRSAAEMLSQRIGLDYASACGASCCG